MAAAAPGAGMSDQYGELFRDCWWAAVATLTRLTGDLEAAEDAVQDACALALTKWPAEGVPSSPRGWLIGVARHKALDRLRRESRRARLEAAAMRDWPATADEASSEAHSGAMADDELALIFMCCHPALDPEARIALTLRCVCGLATADIAAAFVVPEPTLAQRLVRARRKIRQAGIRLRPPDRDDLPRRLAAVLRVIYLVYTQGHMAAAGPDLVRSALCEQAIRLARALAVLIPGEPEVAGLLALLLITDARRAARTSDAGDLVPLGDQDRDRWDAARIAEGTALLEQALTAGRPGPYQLHAAIAACHVQPDTDWREIAALYGELTRYEPTAVTEANRAVAVAMAEGPAAGLAILDSLGTRLARWPQFHIARAELLHKAGRTDEAIAAFRKALALPLPRPAQAFLQHRIADLAASQR
jgi:RNA polymerase sigma-70 factor (ECF subfamily)